MILVVFFCTKKCSLFSDYEGKQKSFGVILKQVSGFVIFHQLQQYSKSGFLHFKTKKKQQSNLGKLDCCLINKKYQFFISNEYSPEVKFIFTCPFSRETLVIPLLVARLLPLSFTWLIAFAGK
jgi:hypothetical protein